MVFLAHFKGRKYFTFLMGIVVILWPTFCLSSQNQTNAKLVNYIFGRFDYSYFLLIPDNIQEYTYLGHYPLTAFIFLHHYDKNKISELTVKELKSRSLGNSYSDTTSNNFYDVLMYDKLKGFEKIAENLTKMDEFQIYENKSNIIAELLKVYDNYRNEYLMYLKGIEGTYIFRKNNLDTAHLKKLEEYNGPVYIKEPSPRSYYEMVDIEDYDLDRQVVSIETLSPISIIDSSVFAWETYYKKIKYRHKNMESGELPIFNNTDFPDKIQIHLSIKDVNKLLAGKDKIYCETILTVKPYEGSFGYEGNAVFIKTSNFTILKIIKNYYKGRSWSPVERNFIEKPTCSIQLESHEENTSY